MCNKQITLQTSESTQSHKYALNSHSYMSFQYPNKHKVTPKSLLSHMHTLIHSHTYSLVAFNRKEKISTTFIQSSEHPNFGMDFIFSPSLLLVRVDD